MSFGMVLNYKGQDIIISHAYLVEVHSELVSFGMVLNEVYSILPFYRMTGILIKDRWESFKDLEKEQIG